MKTFRKLGWTFFVFGFVTCSGCVREQLQRPPSGPASLNKGEPIACTVTCSLINGHVWAKVVFSNATDSTVMVWKRNLLVYDYLGWEPLEVRLKSRRVHYVGMLANMAPPSAADFQPIRPREVSEAAVDVSANYDLSKPGKYEIKYYSINGPPPKTSGKTFSIESPPVSFKQ